MIFPDVIDISIIGVFDRGEPNLERIVLRTNTWVNLSEYGMMIGILGPHNLASPIYDHLYYFKTETFLIPDSWIFLYTGPGKDISSKMPDSEEPAYIFHWGKPFTVFAWTEIIPILFRIGSVQLGYPPGDKIQLGTGE